jgi:hypothetical protein
LVALYGLGTGLFLALAGAATYLWAPKVGSNPWSGVLLGPTFASREVWDWANCAGGLLLALVGLRGGSLLAVVFTALRSSR